MEDALVKMQVAMLETKFGRAISDPPTTKPRSPDAVGDSGDRLARLKELRDKGLISQEEYEAKRKTILDAL